MRTKFFAAQQNLMCFLIIHAQNSGMKFQYQDPFQFPFNSCSKCYITVQRVPEKKMGNILGSVLYNKLCSHWIHSQPKNELWKSFKREI